MQPNVKWFTAAAACSVYMLIRDARMEREWPVLLIAAVACGFMILVMAAAYFYKKIRYGTKNKNYIMLACKTLICLSFILCALFMAKGSPIGLFITAILAGAILFCDRFTEDPDDFLGEMF